MGSGALLINGRKDHRLQMNSVAHRNHDFLDIEQRLRGGQRRSLLGCGRDRTRCRKQPGQNETRDG